MIKAAALPKPHELVEYPDGTIVAVMFHYLPEETAINRVCAANGYEFVTLKMEDDLDENDPIIQAWIDGEDVVARWIPPEFPSGHSGFSFGGKWDTEDGPVACYLRNLTLPVME
ncbi:MAG: hypothetical protein Q7N50_13655 [Armatimonadota bacterium]|nr:hypothetical protein [Armatimonadota bacterium]